MAMMHAPLETPDRRSANRTPVLENDGSDPLPSGADFPNIYRTTPVRVTSRWGQSLHEEYALDHKISGAYNADAQHLVAYCSVVHTRSAAGEGLPPFFDPGYRVLHVFVHRSEYDARSSAPPASRVRDLR
jgi:hypothetical protein